MHIYFSGIGGAGLSALAHLAVDVGYEVTGSDREENENTKRLRKRDVAVHIGQDGTEIEKANDNSPIDWVVITSALPEDHPEIAFAHDNGIKISKRDEFINKIISDKDLKLLAVSGTHGKTTTTGMAIWVFKQLNIPVSYAIGTNISYGKSAEFNPESQWFVYEADEFDRNMLQFEPEAAIIPSLDFDHSDTYESVSDYRNAFRRFVNQCDALYTWESVARLLQPIKLNPLFTKSDGESRAEESELFMAEGKIFDDDVKVKAPRLPGKVIRRNGLLVVEALYDVLGTSELNDNETVLYSKIMDALESFPGTERRFEEIAKNVYSDYAHHPREIEATINIASELTGEDHGDIIVVYQPHQNIRQHKVKGSYERCFEGVDKLYWLPTYLSREDPDLKVLDPYELTTDISESVEVEIVNLNKKLIQKVKKHQNDGDIILLLGAGSIDPYFRENLER